MVKVKVFQDTDPASPREYDNVGVMACWHRRYNLGDVQPKESPEEWLRENAPEGSIVLPLFLYDHSGITMSTSSARFSAFDHEGWDWGQVGVIVATPKKIRENFLVKRITKKIRERAESVLRAEVAEYDAFLTGDVWGFTVEDDKGEIQDSCWGFLGPEGVLDAMKEHVEDQYHSALEEAWDHRGEGR